MIRKVSGCLCKDTGFCYRAEASNPRPMGHSVCVACKSLLKYWMTQPQLASLWERMVKKKKRRRRRRIHLQFDPCVRRIPWKQKWQPTPVFLPGKSHGQRSLACCSPWGCKESDMTEQLAQPQLAGIPFRKPLVVQFLSRV